MVGSWMEGTADGAREDDWVVGRGHQRVDLYPPRPHLPRAPPIQSRRVFIMNTIPTIPPQGIGAVSLISEGMAPILYGESYS